MIEFERLTEIIGDLSRSGYSLDACKKEELKVLLEEVYGKEGETLKDKLSAFREELETKAKEKLETEAKNELKADEAIKAAAIDELKTGMFKKVCQTAFLVQLNFQSIRKENAELRHS